MQHRLSLAVVGLAVGATALTTACGSSSSGSGGSDSLTIGYSSPVASQPSQQGVIQGLKSGAKSVDGKAEVLDANLSPDTQVSNVQTMVQKKYGAIALWTLDAGAMQGTFAQVKSAGIPLIGVNSESDDMTSTVWWQLNLCEGDDAPFKQTAQQIAKWRPHAKVVVMGGPAVPSIQANVKCFTEGAKEAGLTVLTERDNVKDNSSSAQSLASDLLTKYKDIDAIWAYNDATALGVSAALTQAGQKISDGTSAGVIVTGVNGDTDAISAIKQGRLTGTWDPDPVATGLAVVKAAKDAKDGNPDKRLVVKSTFWSAANMSDYKSGADRGYTLDNIPLVK